MKGKKYQVKISHNLVNNNNKIDKKFSNGAPHLNVLKFGLNNENNNNCNFSKNNQRENQQKNVRNLSQRPARRTNNNYANKSTTETQLSLHTSAISSIEDEQDNINDRIVIINQILSNLTSPLPDGSVSGDNNWTGKNTFAQSIVGVPASEYFHRGGYKDYDQSQSPPEILVRKQFPHDSKFSFSSMI